MIKNFIQKLTSTNEKQRVLKNFFSLSVLQVANYILPLITLPYLVRVLGADKYGLISFAQASIQYFIILIDYGFGVSATRQVSINRDNKEKLSNIVSSVFVVKIFFLFVSIFILTAVLFLVPRFRFDWILYVYSFGMVIENVIFPVWFFQGVENMKYITIRNIFAKLFFTALIFVFIQKPCDYLYVPLINSLGMIIAGLAGLIPMFKKYSISLKMPSYKDCLFQLSEGWHIFTSRLFISAYTTSNTFILGLFTNNEIVGYYSAAEKIYKAIEGIRMPVAISLFPYFSKKIHDDQEKAIIQFRKLFHYAFCLIIILSLFIFLTSPFLVHLLLGRNYENSIIILKILAGVTFSSWGNFILGILGLLNFGYKEVFSRYVMTGGIIHIVLLLITINQFGYLSVPIVWFCTETMIYIFEYRFLREKGMLPSLKEGFHLIISKNK